MVSYSSNIFENEIGSIIILIVIINSLPNLLNIYMGPQFLKSVKNNDITRNFVIFLGIFVLIHISNIETNKVLASVLVFLFLLIFSRQTFIFTLLEILMITFIFIKYNNNDDLSSLWNYIYVLILTMLFGYHTYYKKQISDKGEFFSLCKFVFGKKQSDYDFDYHYLNIIGN